MIHGIKDELATQNREGGRRSTPAAPSGERKKQDHQREAEQPPQNPDHENAGSHLQGAWPGKQYGGELQGDQAGCPSIAQERSRVLLQLARSQHMDLMKAVNPDLCEWCVKNTGTKEETDWKVKATTESD